MNKLRWTVLITVVILLSPCIYIYYDITRIKAEAVAFADGKFILSSTIPCCEFVQHPLDDSYTTSALFKFVRDHDYCSKILNLVEGIDEFGHKTYNVNGYYEFTIEEFEHMKKYKDIITFINAGNEFPKFHAVTP